MNSRIILDKLNKMWYNTKNDSTKLIYTYGVIHLIADNKGQKSWTVYMHQNKTNGKRYIGITSKSPEKRWGNGGIGYKKHTRFWNAIQKYGWNNFDHVILFNNIEHKLACDIEKQLIREFKTKDPQCGYNLTDGGEGVTGFSPSEETRKKLSEKLQGENNPNYGQHKTAGEKHFLYGKSRPEETKKKISETRKIRDYSGPKSPNWGRKFSEEVKEKIKVNHADFSGENSAWFGRNHTDESKKKMSDAKKGKNTGIEHHNYKPVYCIELNQIFWGVKEAKDKFNMSSNNITQCCRGNVKSVGKHPVTGEKLHWLYVNDQIDKNGAIIHGAITLGYITQAALDQYINNIKSNSKQISIEVQGGLDKNVKV
jgi:group I intron endonuclease